MSGNFTDHFSKEDAIRLKVCFYGNLRITVGGVKPEVSIIRKAKRSQYVSIANALAQDNRLSFEARGVLLYLLSKPDDWVVQFTDVEKEGGIGRDKRQRIFTELEGSGYFERVDLRGSSGQFGYDYVVHELPKTPLPENPVAVDIPAPENPEVRVPEKPEPANPVAANIRIQIPEETKNREERDQLLLTAFKEFFPDCHLNCFQQDQIGTLVSNVDIWRAACHRWALNGWQPRKVEGLIELYDRLVEEKKNPPKQLSPHPVVAKDPCPYCSGGKANQCPLGGKEGKCRW